MPGRHRVRLRLTAWYAGITFALLLAGTAVMRTASVRAIEREFHAGQDGAATLARSFFRAELNEYRTVEATLSHITGELVFPDRRLVFVAPEGREWTAPSSVRLPALLPLDPPIHWAEYPLDPELAPGWRLRLGVSRAAAERQRRTADLLALVAIPLAGLAAGLVGWMVAGRALSPIGTMAEAAEAISAARPAARLPVDSPSDEIGRLGGAFNALLSRLEGALSQQRRFLADAAHELRTPLARARGALDLARQEGGNAAAPDALVQTERELAAMGRLVDELLQLARADADPQPARLAAGFVDDVVADAVVAFQPVARQHGIALEAEVMEESPAHLDAALVRQLVGILIDNALRYTPEGGSVSVEVTPAAAGGGAVLRVRDTGIGIDPAERERLFQRFFRGERARALSPDGAGLGLAIARWVADQHGARLTLDPAPGGGTLAEVQFPAAGTFI